MRAGILAMAAALAVLAPVGMAQAQWTLANVGPPRNPPPIDFQGREFVDSRGCVYIRAGFNGIVNWVPRVTRGRQVMCGRQPTRVAGAGPVVITPDTGAGADGPVLGRVVVRPPLAEQRHLRVFHSDDPSWWEGQDDSGPAMWVREGPQEVHPGDLVRAQQAADAGRPLAAGRYVLSDGAAPPAGQRAVNSDDPPAGEQARRQGRIVIVVGPEGAVSGVTAARHAGQVLRPVDDIIVPPGWRSLRDPPRPNPLSGAGTAAGQAAMDRVWTREVPQRLVVQTVPLHRAVAVTRQAAEARPMQVTASTRDAAAAGRYIQVASFTVAANAERTRAGFEAAGLPVELRRMRRGEQLFRVVVLGPFDAPDRLQAALRAARGAGFPDAFVLD